LNESSRVEELLDQLLKVAAATAVQRKSLSDGAPYLDRLGIGRGVVAAIYDTSEASVRAILSQARKDSERGKKGSK